MNITSTTVRGGTPITDTCRTQPNSVAAAPATVPGEPVRWDYRPGAEGELADISAGQWADPVGAGWQLVKENARRDVWRLAHRGRVYYVKYYFVDTLRDRLSAIFRAPPFKAEWDSGVYAARHEIPAVRPIACTMHVARRRTLDGRAVTSSCAALVTEGVEPATPLSEFWLQLSTDADNRRRRNDQRQLIEQLASMIARAHQAGFEHRDMHAANILVQPVGPRCYRTLLVDLHSAHRGASVRAHAVVRNLAQLNQWFRRHATIGDRLRFLRAYIRWRLAFEPHFETSRPLALDFAGLVRALDRAAAQHLEQLGRRRDHRVGRDGRYFSRIKLAGGWRGPVTRSTKHASPNSRATQLVFTRAWWREQFASPLDWFTSSADGLCKVSHSAVVRRALLPHPDGPLPVILKRPVPRNWHRRLVQLLFGSRSARTWRTGHALLNRDVPTARPLAYIERRWGPFVLDSVSVVEAVPGAVDLEQFIRREAARRDPQAWQALKRRLVQRLATHIRRLHSRGFEHRDCKASNILVSEHPALQLLWIDMDGIRKARGRRDGRDVRALIRLHVSLLDAPGIGRTDRIRFLKLYLARFGASSTAWRSVVRTIEHGASRKLAALAVRRAWKLRHYGRT